MWSPPPESGRFGVCRTCDYSTRSTISSYFSVEGMLQQCSSASAIQRATPYITNRIPGTAVVMPKPRKTMALVTSCIGGNYRKSEARSRVGTETEHTLKVRKNKEIKQSPLYYRRNQHEKRKETRERSGTKPTDQSGPTKANGPSGPTERQSLPCQPITSHLTQLRRPRHRVAPPETTSNSRPVDHSHGERGPRQGGRAHRLHRYRNTADTKKKTEKNTHKTIPVWSVFCQRAIV